VFKTKVTKYIHLALSETKLLVVYTVAITVLLFKQNEEILRVREGRYHFLNGSYVVFRAIRETDLVKKIRS
jgi:hypothetical protein